MIFKKNNPGCPCCNCPCACYKFDDNGNDSMGSHDLTATNATYATGKLDKAAQFTGTQYFEHDHDNCFVPGSTGINVWFWIKRVAPVGSTLTDRKIEYVVSKGQHADVDSSAFLTPNRDANGFSGTWSIFIAPEFSNSGSFNDIHFAVAYESGNYDIIVETDSWEEPTAWVFFYWWYEPTAGSAGPHTGRCSLIRNSTTIADETTVSIGVTDDPMRQTDTEKLYVGKNLGKHRSETIQIDNLGICKNIGTKAEMTARAAALYNSGNGLACNNSGK